MVGPREGPVAQLAVERLVAGVLALVPRQLIRAGEPPTAVVPLADIGLLPGVGAQVGLQVRRLGVGLPAARLVADVHRRGLPLQHNHHLLLLLQMVVVVVVVGR